MTKPKPANPALSISHPDLASALAQIGLGQKLCPPVDYVQFAEGSACNCRRAGDFQLDELRISQRL